MGKPTWTRVHSCSQVLLETVIHDGYYKLSEIRAKVALEYDYNPHWLSERYIGGLLRRLGFASSRRVGSGTEFFLTTSEVKDCAERLGISELGEHSEGSEE